LLLLLSARLCGCREHNAEYLLGSVVEYIHTASLLHDDVVDEARIRRGRSSANSLWGNQASILVGDYLYSKALYHAVRIQNQRIMDVLSETTTTMSEGEVLQLTQIQNADLAETEYFRLVECKTGVLISAACRLGAIISKAPLSQEDALTAYGKKLGLSFQITDDTLDYAADQHQLGKVLGKDLDEGKVTLPLIYLMRKANAGEKDNLRNILGADVVSEYDLTYTLGLMTKHGAVDEALGVAQSLSNDAKATLTVFPNSVPRRALMALADFVVQREM
jgi:octaprenyl-diphosphate synthase